MEQTTNRIELRGSLAELPQFSHENHDKRFYRFTLEVERLSGTVDLLPVIVPEPVLCAMDLSGASMLEITGQIRSFNSRAATGRKLVISVYAETLAACEGEPMNNVTLSGVVCKEPVYRITPLGREICDVMLCVPRTYQRTDYLPCITWGKTAQQVAACQVRDVLQITGRLQSRVYTKVTDAGTEERTAYEISALTAQVLESSPQEDNSGS